MVERPIKKSERVARDNSEGKRDQEGRGGDRRERSGGKGRKGGRGKGRRDREEKKPAIPPALMRGPKPKPKVEVPEPEPEIPEEETVLENANAEDISSESTETPEATA
ncbi:MAG: hypothetical protein F6K42_16040 [Leptolyngbya sp. SIO1D8]|nr:hypothetical protein [Leptolyngbya sp. SIO1D8]